MIKYFCQAHHRFTRWSCFRFPCAGNAGGCHDPERPSSSTKSNKMASQKRAVLQMAFGYAGAWLLVWTPYFVAVVFIIVTKSVPEYVIIWSCFMMPLQGFFNFVVFMAPKVRTTRTKVMWREGRGRSNDNQNQQQHLTWCQAFYKAYMDRGRRLDNRNMRIDNRTEIRSLRTTIRKIKERFRTLSERMKFYTATSSMSTPPTTTTTRVAETSNEC